MLCGQHQHDQNHKEGLEGLNYDSLAIARWIALLDRLLKIIRYACVERLSLSRHG